MEKRNGSPGPGQPETSSMHDVERSTMQRGGGNDENTTGASPADYLNSLPILYLDSGGQRTHSNRLPTWLPIFVGPTNSPL